MVNRSDFECQRKEINVTIIKLLINNNLYLHVGSSWSFQFSSLYIISQMNTNEISNSKANPL